ncbi:LytTR family transcriptional regulator [Rhodobacteraceae bacterium HSP-20]|uniref:LytTR family transcriptional regulator n=1 Tax=Paragemmobacter amnigenus TaxID=2852097 RepID=A0ABS6JB10_9RHOB|nr:LytTR family DNA-binding domain-containing protein [Rhodobacter amnigenus]MBU9699672.1 LytTR family transcriptional regulator [Rhodobacter amnigenus]MBV4390899.1 LytTR family transcriptional regulator [Rhodobacter amnigenus]
MNGVQATVSTTQVKFADGKTYWATSDSLTEFFLNPIFLKYFLLCTLVYGLLDRGGKDTGHLAGFEIVVLWSTLSVVTFSWYFLLFSALRVLRNRGVLTTVYTPFITLSLFCFTTTATYLVVTFFKGPLDLTAAEWTQEIVRDMIVLLLMDVAFSQFVAPLHPMLLPYPPGDPRNATAGPHRHAVAAPALPAAAPPDPVQTAPASPEPAADAPAPALQTDLSPAQIDQVRIGNEVFAVEDLLYIRSEDHYLRIVTSRRRMLTRGRLSDAIAQLDIRQGIQINRSTWVSFNAIQSTEDDGRGVLSVILSDGEQERVAQSRRIAFQSAMGLRATAR